MTEYPYETDTPSSDDDSDPERAAYVVSVCFVEKSFPPIMFSRFFFYQSRAGVYAS